MPTLPKRCAQLVADRAFEHLEGGGAVGEQEGQAERGDLRHEADDEPWLLTVMSTAPVRRLVSSDCSLPSCSAPATRTVMRPRGALLDQLGELLGRDLAGIAGGGVVAERQVDGGLRAAREGQDGRRCAGAGQQGAA